jgi:hypothetical protein
VRRRRDDALERTRSITKTIGVASVAAVAALGIYLSRALPGHAATSTATTGTGSTATGGTTGAGGTAATPSTGTPTTGSGSSGSPSPTQLTPPTSPPVQTQRQAPVVSGSS